jgi:3-oxoacyl-[acyl-carrier-protein] synthase-3
MMGIQVPAFDINAVCSGFIYGLEIACSLPYDKVLLIATEKYSAITDYDSRDCVYFGDGAGAVVVAQGTGTIITDIRADGQSGDAFVSKVQQKYSIVGRKVYDKAMEVLIPMMTYKKIDYVIPHQAGLALLRNLINHAGYPVNKLVTVMDRYAYIASASIPIAMNETKDVLNKRLLLVAIGSGWTWGTAIIKP